MLFAAPKLDDEIGRLAALRRYEILDTSSEEEFEQIIDLVQRVFDVPMAAVTLIDSDRQWFKARRGLVPSETPRSMAFCHYTIASAEGLAVDDAEADPRFAGTPLVVGEPHIRSYLGAPLRTPDGYQVGALCIIGNKTRHFSPEDREILGRFSEIVVSQMELRHLVSRDSLTGVLSRRAFGLAVHDAIEAYRREGIPCSLAIVDIDYFKRINDRYGHATGDATLVAVTAALTEALGPRAMIGRLGGEEFGVLIESDDRCDVATAAEGLRAIVAGARVPNHDFSITCSIGVAVLSSAITTPAMWMKYADRALYAAKGAGRDRVMMD